MSEIFKKKSEILEKFLFFKKGPNFQDLFKKGPNLKKVRIFKKVQILKKGTIYRKGPKFYKVSCHFSHEKV